VIKVHEGVGRPELLLQLFTSHDLSGALEQQREDLKGLPLEPHFHAALAQFAGRQVHFEESESDNSARILWSGHGRRRSVALQTQRFGTEVLRWEPICRSPKTRAPQGVQCPRGGSH
jgi:hypothetical protein